MSRVRTRFSVKAVGVFRDTQEAFMRGSELIKYGVTSAESFGRESFRFRAGSAGPINTERLERRLGIRVRTLTFTP